MYHNIVSTCCHMNNKAMATNETSNHKAMKVNGSSSHSNSSEQKSICKEPTSTQQPTMKENTLTESKENSHKSSNRNKSPVKVSEVQTDPSQENINNVMTNGEMEQSGRKNNIDSVHSHDSGKSEDSTNHSISNTCGTSINGKKNKDDETIISNDSAYASKSVGDLPPQQSSDTAENEKDQAPQSPKKVSFTEASPPSGNTENATRSTANNDNVTTTKGKTMLY